ncbi:MAG: hypothetical protein ACK515_05455 [bacterium]|nr:hypothetical protein [Betaproteobacteria bacterium]
MQPLVLTHAGFRQAWADGGIRVDIDPRGAYRYLAAQMLLPLVQLAVLGIGVGMALLLHWFPGVLVIIVGFLLPRLSRASAPAFMLKRALEDDKVYDDLVRSGILRIFRF